MKGFAQMRQLKVCNFIFWFDLNIQNVLQWFLAFDAEIFVEAKSYTYLYTDDETETVVLME